MTYKLNNFMDCARMFLQEYSRQVKENTLKRYENDLALFYLYMERYGSKDIFDLSWKHIEEFFSWWYLRQYMGCSLNGARGLFATLKKFCHWLDKYGIVSLSQSWNYKNNRNLKENIERILRWEREVAEIRSFGSICWHEDDIEYAEITEGWFKIIQFFKDKGALKSLVNNSAYIVRFEGLIAEYIKPGDIISTAICRDSRGFYINDNIIWFFYPPTASTYIK
ncbi:MAG: hypothetical protein ACOCVN_01685 [bacterium]